MKVRTPQEVMLQYVAESYLTILTDREFARPSCIADTDVTTKVILFLPQDTVTFNDLLADGLVYYSETGLHRPGPTVGLTQKWFDLYIKRMTEHDASFE